MKSPWNYDFLMFFRIRSGSESVIAVESRTIDVSHTNLLMRLSISSQVFPASSTHVSPTSLLVEVDLRRSISLTLTEAKNFRSPITIRSTFHPHGQPTVNR